MLKAEKVIIRTSRAGNNGFTLIELVVVLLIVGVAAGVVIVSISNEYRKAAIKYEVRKVFSALNYARELSITRHAELTFEINENNTGYSIYSGEKSFYQRTLPRGITIYSEKIDFFPLGDSTGGTISMADENGRKYEIIVSQITGKARVERVQSI